MALELPTEAIPTDIQLYQPEKFPTSRSGLGEDYIQQIMSSLMPEFQQSVGGITGNIDKYMQNAMGMSVGAGQDLLGPILQSKLNSLVGRGMMDSKVASTSFGAATGDVLKNVQNQSLQAGMEGAKLNLGLPDMLGQLMQLGQTTEAQDPSIPVRTMASLFAGAI